MNNGVVYIIIRIRAPLKKVLLHTAHVKVLTIFETVVVGVDDAADAVAVRLPGVAVEGEAVAHAAVHHPSEPEGQESTI